MGQAIGASLSSVSLNGCSAQNTSNHAHSLGRDVEEEHLFHPSLSGSRPPRAPALQTSTSGAGQLSVRGVRAIVKYLASGHAGPSTTHLACDFGYLTLWALSCQSGLGGGRGINKPRDIDCHGCTSLYAVLSCRQAGLVIWGMLLRTQT